MGMDRAETLTANGNNNPAHSPVGSLKWRIWVRGLYLRQAEEAEARGDTLQAGYLLDLCDRIIEEAGIR
jgi:hypothetical protein